MHQYARSWTVPLESASAVKFTAAEHAAWEAEFEAAMPADEAERALAGGAPADREREFFGHCGTVDLLGSSTITFAGALFIESGACIDLSGRRVLDLNGSALCLSGG